MQQSKTQTQAEATAGSTEAESKKVKSGWCCENMQDIPEQDTDWYVRTALRTESKDFSKILERLVGPDIARLVVESNLVINPETLRLLHVGMGLETEAAEFMDVLKKFLMYGKPMDKVNMTEELGDLMWYVAVAADTLGISLSDILRTNIKKLRKRFPEKFTEHYAVNRDLKTERATLEKGVGSE